MTKYNSLLSSLALGIGLTLGISTPAVAYPRNHNARESRVIIVHPSRAYNVTPRSNRSHSRYNSRYERDRYSPQQHGRDRHRHYYGRGRDYHDGYHDNDYRDGRRRRYKRNITITNPPIYRNNLSVPNYIRIRTVR